MFVTDKSYIRPLTISMFSKVRKMRKTTVLFLVLVLTLVPMALINQAKADIQQWTWLPPYISKVDGSYVIYKHGTTASLVVPVKNDVVTLMNVSKVYITFDWNANKTLDLSASPKQIKSGATEFFTVSFTADAAEAISGSLQHTYDVTAVYVNATGGFVDKLTKAWDALANDLKFVVYSTDQADTLNLAKEYTSYVSNFPPATYFTGAEAKKLVRQAQIAAYLGNYYYNTTVDYASSRTQYTAAINLYSQALVAEEEYIAAGQAASLNTTMTNNAATKTEADADMKLAEAAKTEADAALVEANAAVIQANATVKQADAALTNAYGFYFIGLGFALGWSFMGIGVIIYAWKKPKPAA